MSLYDDASLVLLPSGGAGKDGKVFSVKPVPEYGNELITNGGFDADSDWIKGTGWTISAGTANCDGTQTSTSQLRTSVGLSIQNTLVKFSFEVKNYSAGTLTATIEGTGGNEFSGINSNGVYTIQATSSDSTPRIAFNADSSFIGSIDNVSVKEVITGDGDFTFSRGSNLAATRVDSNGLIEKGRENLLTYSNQFDTTWGGNPANRSILSGYAGYDGSNDAWKLEAISDNNYSVVSQVVSSTGVETFSVYAKAGTSNFFRIQITGGTNTSAAYFDLSGSGSVGTNFNNIYAKIEPVGNGWFRCSVTGNKTTSSTCVILVMDADSSTNVTTGANVYIQDAQLEIGLAATDYIESGATTGKAGLLENEPRFDYSGGATCPSLLLEPQRTNLFNYSEYANGNIFSNSPIVTDNYAVSPEGKQNAFRVQDTDGSNFKSIKLSAGNVIVSANSEHTISVFVKKAIASISTYSGFSIEYTGTSNQISYIIFDEYNGTLTAIQSQSTLTLHDVKDFGDYWRFSVSGKDTGGNTEFNTRLYACLSSNGTSPSLGTKDYTAYGLQCEQGSYPTSYIPNHSGGSVTRNAEDIAINTLDQTYSTDITLFFEVERLVDNADTNKLVFLISDASGGGNNIIQFYSTNNGRMRVLIKGDTSSFDNLFSSNNSFIQGTSVKAAIKITQSGCTLFVDGSSVATTSSVGRVLGIDKINYVKDSIIKQFLLFPTALTDAECMTLTKL